MRILITDNRSGLVSVIEPGDVASTLRKWWSDSDPDRLGEIQDLQHKVLRSEDCLGEQHRLGITVTRITGSWSTNGGEGPHVR